MSAVDLRWMEPGLLRVEFRGAPDDAAFERYLDALSEVLRDEQPYVSVIVDSAGLRTQVSHRQRQAEWIRNHEALIERVCLGTAFVVPSPISRFVLSTILLLARIPTAHKAFEDEVEALAWARERLRLRTAA